MEYNDVPGSPAFDLLESALESLQSEKPNDRSEVDRRYAIIITDLEKVLAYYKTYIV
jgi:hypothetical protein